MTREQLVEETMREFENIIFPSKENDGIEHVDMSYQEFLDFLRSRILIHEKAIAAEMEYKQCLCGRKTRETCFGCGRIPSTCDCGQDYLAGNSEKV